MTILSDDDLLSVTGGGSRVTRGRNDQLLQALTTLQSTVSSLATQQQPRTDLLTGIALMAAMRNS
jgi:hypothetical protein